MPYHRSEEHTSELQSHLNLVCRLLLEKNTHTHTMRNIDLALCIFSCIYIENYTLSRAHTAHAIMRYHSVHVSFVLYTDFFFIWLGPPQGSPYFPHTPFSI